MEILNLIELFIKYGKEWNITFLLLLLVIISWKKLSRIELQLMIFNTQLTEQKAKSIQCRHEVDLELAHRPTFAKAREMINDAVE